MNSDNFYVLGDFRKIEKTKSNVISIFNSEFQCIDKLIIGNESDSLHQITLNKERNEVYASGASFLDVGKESNLMTDTIYLYNFETEILDRIPINQGLDQDKEGGLGNILYNPQTDTIYVSSVYGKGGDPALYFIDRKTKILKHRLELRSYGPQGLEFNPLTNRLYAIGSEFEHSFVVEIDGITEQEIRRKNLPYAITNVSPYSFFQEATMDIENNYIFIILEKNLYRLDLNKSEPELTEISTNVFEFVNICFNNFSKRLYAITQEKIVSENVLKAEYNLVSIKNDEVVPQYKIGHEVEGIFVPGSLNTICLSCVNYANYPHSVRKIFFFREFDL